MLETDYDNYFNKPSDIYSTPQPQPTETAQSKIVLDLVKLDFETVFADQPDANKAQLLAALQARSDYGLAKYGTVLKTDNGRNFQADLLQEILDGIMYARGDLHMNPTDKNITTYQFLIRLYNYIVQP